MGRLIKAFVGAIVLATIGLVYTEDKTKATETKKKNAKDNGLHGLTDVQNLFV